MAAGTKRQLHVHFELLITILKELLITYIPYIPGLPHFKRWKACTSLFLFCALIGILFIQGIPETAEVAVPVARGGVSSAAAPPAAPTAPSSGAPNSAPLNLFPQVFHSFPFIILFCPFAPFVVI